MNVAKNILPQVPKFQSYELVIRIEDQREHAILLDAIRYYAGHHARMRYDVEGVDVLNKIANALVA